MIAARAHADKCAHTHKCTHECRYGDHCSYEGIVYQYSSGYCPTKDVSDAVKAVVGGVLVAMI